MSKTANPRWVVIRRENGRDYREYFIDRYPADRRQRELKAMGIAARVELFR